MTIWLIFAFALFGKLADVISTRLVTPNLALEGNPLIKRFGWAYAWAGVSLALLTFVSADLGIIVGTVSCLMAHSNMSIALISRYATGERKLRELYGAAIRNCSLGSFIGMFLVQYLPLLAVACVLLFFDRFDTEPYVTDVAYGIFCWVLAIVIFKLKAIRVIGKGRVVAPVLH
ncbi:MAG TPA: hypothetical protein VN043_13105 [Rhodanobacter sp.]|nr:hypothetical protein [Rhodanobacter sp.]